MTKKKQEDFYKRLHNELVNSTLWPSEYLYKFIVPSEEQKIQTIIGLFDNMGAVISTRTSGKGNYTSISINVTMKSADQVIEKYQEVGEIEGVISL